MKLMANFFSRVSKASALKDEPVVLRLWQGMTIIKFI